MALPEPQDYLVFPPTHFAVAGTPQRDNTGNGGAAPFEETPIPSLGWPSDHAALFSTLRRIA